MSFFLLLFLLFLAASRRTPAGIALDLFEQHQGTHILQVSVVVRFWHRNTQQESKG